MHNIHSIMLQRLLRVIRKVRLSPKAVVAAVVAARVVHQLDIQVAIQAEAIAAIPVGQVADQVNRSRKHTRMISIEVAECECVGGAFAYGE